MKMHLVSALLAIIAFLLSSQSAQSQAWLHGIPGDKSKTGLVVEDIQFSDNKATILNIKCNSIIQDSLRDIYLEKRKLNSVMLVIQKNPKVPEEVYALGKVRVIQLINIDSNTLSVKMSFETKKLVRMGVTMQPGPPSDEPTIMQEQNNSGWLYLSDIKKIAKPYPFKIQKYSEPDINGQMSLIIAKGESNYEEINEILASINQHPLLVLVLPDTNTLQYIEYKLHNPFFISKNKGNDYDSFEIFSDDIEVLGKR
jgi:hypothetical protein